MRIPGVQVEKVFWNGEGENEIMTRVVNKTGCDVLLVLKHENTRLLGSSWLPRNCSLHEPGLWTVFDASLCGYRIADVSLDKLVRRMKLNAGSALAMAQALVLEIDR